LQSFLQAGWSVGELWALRPPSNVRQSSRLEPLKEWCVRDLLNKFSALAGITKRISPHSLRHTFASFKAEAGVSPFQLQQCPGHSSLDTTTSHVHLARKNAKKVVEATSL